jgi:polysaccharide biosynthesis protein PslH
MRLLFVKNSLAWPRATGHDVYTYHTMKSCVALGHDVSLAVAKEPAARALEGLSLKGLYRLDGFAGGAAIPSPASRLQRKFRSFFGVPESNLAALRHAVEASRAEAVIIAGLDVLPYFPVLTGVNRIWFAADELLWHHLSQLKFVSGDAGHLKEGLLQGLYERAHRSAIDRAWVVSETDRKAMRWFAGVRNVDVLALGVDGEHFAPGDEPVEPRTAVFWGRLDFGPNIQALEWFCRKIWPLVRARVPDARFTIIGFSPTDAVRRVASGPGLTRAGPAQHGAGSFARRPALHVGRWHEEQAAGSRRARDAHRLHSAGYGGAATRCDAAAGHRVHRRATGGRHGRTVER